MEDIAPKLFEKIQTQFAKNLKGNRKVDRLRKKMEQGANYGDAGEYAVEIGQALADAFATCLRGDALPDGRMYWNIAQRVIDPLLRTDHELVSEYAVAVQAYLNQLGGVRLTVQKAPLDTDRVAGIMNAMCSDNYENVAWVLREPIVNFSQHVADETMRRNVEFQGKAGLHPKVIRRAESRACKWCRDLAGTYEYPDDVPDDFYRRHEKCRCVVEYYPGSGKRKQNVWSKKWTDIEKSNKSGIIKENDLDSFSIGKSLGAKSRNYRVEDKATGVIYQFVEGTKIQNPKVFAGYKGAKPLYQTTLDGLMEQYPESTNKWQHCKGIGWLDVDGEEVQAEVHWFQEQNVGKVKFKVKRWLDED